MPVLLRNIVAAGLLVCLLPACSLLPGPKPVPLDKYMLEYDTSRTATGVADGAAVMIVTTPRASGGYDTTRIAYKQKQYGLRYYVKSRWADTPARMLAPLMAEAMNDTGKYQALFAPPGAIAARYRLDSELVRLYQDFTRQPSEVRITLRAQLVSLDENRVLATQLFDISEVADSDDTYGGVQAANRATARLLAELAQFCTRLTD